MPAFYQTPEFWVAVGFFLLLALVFNAARKTILGMLDRRAAGIRAQIEEAMRLKEEAQATLADYRRKQHEAIKEAEDMIRHAREESERLERNARKALEDSLARRREQALLKIAQAEADAVQAVRDTAVDIAVAATRRILAEEITGDRAAALVDGAIAELPNRLH